jgi:hypothetical protein
MAKMFDSLQVVEISTQKTCTQEFAKANRRFNERALLIMMAATMGLSTAAILGVMAVTA